MEERMLYFNFIFPFALVPRALRPSSKPLSPLCFYSECHIPLADPGESASCINFANTVGDSCQGHAQIEFFFISLKAGREGNN